MLQPGEVVVAKLLPTIRARLAQELLRTYDMKQVEVAKVLGITQAAVSHYNTKSRGVDQDVLQRFPEIEEFVDDIAKRIHGGLARSDQISKIDQFCAELMMTARFCDYHKKLGDLDPMCTACFPEPPKP